MCGQRGETCIQCKMYTFLLGEPWWSEEHHYSPIHCKPEDTVGCGTRANTVNEWCSEPASMGHPYFCLALC